MEARHYKVIREIFTLLEQKKFTESISLTEELFEDPEIDFYNGEILRLVNNFLIACYHTSQFEKGIAWGAKYSALGPLNPHIYHNNACLLCKVGSFETAIEQMLLGKKYGGRELAALMKNDPDLEPIRNDPRFQFMTWPEKELTTIPYTVPFDGVWNETFNELRDTCFVSLYFNFQTDVDSESKQLLEKAVSDWKERHPGKLIYSKNPQGWNDTHRIGRNWFEVHLQHTRFPRTKMMELISLVNLIPIKVKHSFFVTRSKDSGNYGSPDVEESHSIGIHPDFIDYRKGYGHHNGSESIELRSVLNRRDVTINPYEFHAQTIEDSTPALTQILYSFLQKELTKFFDGAPPVIMNAKGENKLDCVRAGDRVGFAFELANDELMECWYNRYIFRVCEAEVLKVCVQAIRKFGLAREVAFARGPVLLFQLWQK